MTATNRLIIWNKDKKRGLECGGLWEHTEWSDKKLPGRRRACKSWWSRKWRSHCRRFAPRRGCSLTPNRKVSLADRPAWSPARPLLWHTYRSKRKIIREWEEKQLFHCYLSTGGFKWNTHLKSIRTAWGKVWKLLLRLICIPSTMAIFPKTWKHK